MANLKIFLCNLLLVLTTLIHLCISTQVKADELRPNIVLIMADDLSHKNLSCYGATNFETPNLDKLAATGMRFEHCYSMPLCTPSRVMLMTGQHNGRNFYRASTLEADQRTFGNVANEAGYETCVVGKWKLTGKSKESTPDRFGFDEHYVTEGLRNDSPRYKNPEILTNGKPIKYSDGEYGPDIVCDHAIEFIERKRNEPFLLYYPMILVHTPLSPVPGSPVYAAADQRTDDKLNYPAMVRRMDENVGRIIAKLDELGLRERTIIFFTGDNGTKRGIEMKLKDGSVYLGGKGSTGDNGVHVPLIVNQPGRVPVGVSDALVSFTDFLPTVADITGSELAPSIPCDGRSFLAQCLGKSEPSERESIYQWFSNNPLQDKLVEVAFDQDYRLYGDGSFYNWSADIRESKPLHVDSLDNAAKDAFEKLQQTLQSQRKGMNRGRSSGDVGNAGRSSATSLAANDFRASQQSQPNPSQATPLSKTQPNILWVVTDDHRVDSIVAFNQMRHGTPDSPLGQVLSPNIDRLAKMGTTFINTFNQNPGCAPSRTLMHTGRYSHHTGVYGFEYYNPTGQPHWRPMVPEILRDKAGYQTLAVGKLGIRAQHFADQKGGTEPPLYQTNLGYRKEFSANGEVDWNVESKWVKGVQGPKNEIFFFPSGESLIWPELADSSPNDREEIQERLGLLRHYMPTDADKHSGSILGGANPQTGETTRDGSFTGALLDHLAHAGERYTDMLDRQQTGPSSDKPIFAYIGYEFPHTPVLPPVEFRKKFQKLNYEIPEFTEEEFAAFPPQLKSLYKNSQSDHFTDAEKHQMIADYFAFSAYGDSLVGKAVDGFIEYSEKQDRPWLVLFVCGDHGWRLNEHGMVSKFSHYDTDLHNPIIVVSSDKEKFPAGKVVEDFTCFVDIAPTFLAAAGLDISTSEYKYLDGRGLAKTAAGVLPPRDYIIAEPTWVIGPRAVIRTKDYKFAMKIRPRVGHTMTEAAVGKNFKWAITAELTDIEPTLFDLRNDPNEINNVAYDPSYRPVLDALRAKLQDIVLGDDRIEIAWTNTKTNLPVHQSNFAPGSDDGVLVVPARQQIQKQKIPLRDKS